jgi:hypothetical protein
VKPSALVTGFATPLLSSRFPQASASEKEFNGMIKQKLHLFL